MRSPFMQSLQSRLANPAFQRGITEAGLSILANSGPSTQPMSTGQILAGGAMQGMQAYEMENERQQAMAKEQEFNEAAKEAAGGIENPALQRLAMADPKLARDILIRQMEREATPIQQAQLEQGERRIGLEEERAAAAQEMANKQFGLSQQKFGLAEQNAAAAQDMANRQFGLDQQNAEATQAYRQADLGMRQQDFARQQELAQRDDQQRAAKQGHYEAIAAQLPEEQRPAFYADPDGYIANLQKAQTDEFNTEVSRILQANPQLAESEDGLRQAQNIALDLVKSATDPVRGGTATYNLATGEGSPIQTPNPELDRLGPSGQPISIDQMAGEIGAIPFTEDVIAKTLGQAAPRLVDEARTKAATQLDFLKQKAITALSTSSRPPVIEQQRIESLFPSKGIFDSQERARQQLSHLRDIAVTTHDDYVGLIESGQLPFKQENELRGKVAELRQVAQMLPNQDAASQPQEQQASVVAPEIATASQSLGVSPDKVMEAAKEAGVSPEQIIQKLQERNR